MYIVKQPRHNQATACICSPKKLPGVAVSSLLPLPAQITTDSRLVRFQTKLIILDEAYFSPIDLD